MAADHKYEETEYIIYGLLIVVLNISLYTNVSLLQDFRNALGTLTKFLAFVDILIGAVFLTDGIMMKVHFSPDVGICLILSYVLNLSFGITTTLFGCISYDRYSAIMHPDRYATTQPRAYASAWFVCILNGALFLPSLLGWGVDMDMDKSKAASPQPPCSCITHWAEYSAMSFFFLSTLMVANMFISAVCYFHILDTCIRLYHESLDKHTATYYSNNSTELARRSSMKNDDERPSLDKHRSTYYNSNNSTEPAWAWRPIMKNDKERLTAKVFLGIITLSYTMWMPFMLLTYINLTMDLWIPPSIYSLFLRFGLATSIMKFAIYLIFLPSFRHGLIGLCCLLGGKCVDFIVDALESYETDNWEEVTVNTLVMGQYRSI